MSIPRRWRGVVLVAGGCLAAGAGAWFGSFLLGFTGLALAFVGEGMVRDYAFGRTDE